MEKMVKCEVFTVHEGTDDEMVKAMERTGRPDRGHRPPNVRTLRRGGHRKLTPERVREIYTAAHPFSAAVRRELRQNTVFCIVNRITYADVTEGLVRGGR